MAISVVTVGELRAGVLAAGDVGRRDLRLRTLTRALELDAFPIDEAVADAWARLRVVLRDVDRRMAVNDSWIAATAIALDVPVVTQDADYVDAPRLGRHPGLIPKNRELVGREGGDARAEGRASYPKGSISGLTFETATPEPAGLVAVTRTWTEWNTSSTSARTHSRLRRGCRCIRRRRHCTAATGTRT